MGEQSGMDTGLRVLSILISGLVFYGGLGWLADRWLQTSWCLPVGLVVGTAAGVYLVIARYGRST
ncbi:hypothetical protein PROP_03184 [Propionicimonas sp. T2.31MG-18]|uniref:AtpZ/AtpI family protein n=1 Tax=Propionicimonas sp. T2.31MG-18 TaxID=3157620 RepID=UPI0035EECF5A